MLPELPEQADHTPYTHRKRAAAAHCVSLSQAPPDCTRCPEPARRPSSLCYLCRPAYSASLQGGTVQAIMSATVPPGLCESSHAHSGAFVFRIPGLPSVPLLIPFPAERPLRALSHAGQSHAQALGPADARGRLRFPRGPGGKPPDDEPRSGRTGEAQSSEEPPLLKSSRNSACPPMACHQALLKMPGTGLSRAQQGGLLRQRTASFSPRIIQQLSGPRDFSLFCQ